MFFNIGLCKIHETYLHHHQYEVFIALTHMTTTFTCASHEYVTGNTRFSTNRKAIVFFTESMLHTLQPIPFKITLPCSLYPGVRQCFMHTVISGLSASPGIVPANNYDKTWSNDKNLTRQSVAYPSFYPRSKLHMQPDISTPTL